MNYDDFKKKMDGLDESKRQQVADLMWNSQMDATYKNYWDQYQSEMNNSQQKTSQASNSFSSPETTYQNQQQNQPTYQPQQQQQVQQQPTYDPNEKLDTNMFGATDGKVKVQEGTAKYTGKADFSLNSDARMQEITNNLNAYWQNNPEYFSDRDTYNKMFNYNERSNEQKALLDSYWKKKEGMDTAQRYNTWDSILNGMNDAEITNDQLNYIKEYSPEAYREWQQKQQDEINLRIANLATPADPTANAELFQSISKKLNLDPWDSYQIYDNWTSMCERLWVFSDSEKLSSYQNQLNQNHQKMEQIMSRYANSAGWTVSDALAAARMQKALAPYQQVEANLQNSYQILLNGRNSNLALANQSVQVMQAQAQEDQRIFNQRLQGLGFAMQTASYRTPEQQAQLQLTTQAISNEMNLLQQSKQQDLNLYNQYAGAKLQNQLQNELTDLSVSDPKQLRANLNNALTSYYEQYGDIIQRSQAQVVDDIINYANEKGISVAQAMTENFIKPLQWKAEYKNLTAEKYGMNKYQQQYSYTVDENWNVVVKASWYGEIPQSAFETRASRQEAFSDVYDSSYSWNDYIMNLTNSIKDWSYWWQCGAFVNDVLVSWGDSKVFWDSLSQKISKCNVPLENWPQQWYAVVFDLWFKSSDGVNHGHVGIISKVNPDGSVDVLESNGKSDEKIHVKTYSKEEFQNKVRGYYKPSTYDLQDMSNKELSTKQALQRKFWNNSTWNDNWYIESLETEFKTYLDKGKSAITKDQWADLKKDYGINEQEFREMAQIYAKTWLKKQGVAQAEKALESAMLLNEMLYWKDIIDNPQSWLLDMVNEYIPWTSSYDAKKQFNTLSDQLSLNELFNAKANGATFGAMSESEWDILKRSATNLDRDQSNTLFKQNLQTLMESLKTTIQNWWGKLPQWADKIWNEIVGKIRKEDIAKKYNLNSVSGGYIYTWTSTTQVVFDERIDELASL